MTRSRRMAVLAVALVAAAGCGRETARERPVHDDGVAVSHRAAAVEWETDLDDAVERARAEAKPVLANFYADWCVWCRRLDTTTMRDPKVAALISERLIPVKLDVDRGGREASARFGVDGLPTVLVLGPDGAELGRIPGYMPPGAFLDAVAAMLPPGTQS